MNARILKILWLYPDILNLHGDRGNLMALLRTCETFGIDADIRRVNRLTEDFDLAEVDLVLINPGELVAIQKVTDVLLKKAEAFCEHAASGKGILAVGTSGAILSKETMRQNGDVFAGLGLLDMTIRERTAVYGDDIIIRTDDLEYEIAGTQIRMADAFLEADQAPLGKVLYGLGNMGEGLNRPPGKELSHDANGWYSGNGNQTGAPSQKNDTSVLRCEGAQRDNVIFTNLLGPVLVKNPWFTRRIIERILINKYSDADIKTEMETALAASGKTKEELWPLELNSLRAVCAFNQKKTPGLQLG